MYDVHYVHKYTMDRNIGSNFNKFKFNITIKSKVLCISREPMQCGPPYHRLVVGPQAKVMKEAFMATQLQAEIMDQIELCQE